MHRVEATGSAAQRSTRIYRMKDETIIRALGITEKEIVALDFKHLLTPGLKRAKERARWHVRRAADGGVSREEYLAESIERQKALAGRKYKPADMVSASRGTGPSGCMMAKPPVAA